MPDLEEELRHELASQASGVQSPLTPPPGYIEAIKRHRSRRALVASGAAALSLLLAVAIGASALSGGSGGNRVEVGTASRDTGGKEMPAERSEEPAHDDPPAAQAAVRAVNDLVNRHPHAFVGIVGVAGKLHEIVAVIGKDQDLDHWTSQVKDAAGEFPARVKQCEVTVPQLKEDQQRVSQWAKTRPPQAAGIAYTPDAATCAIRVAGNLTAAEKADLHRTLGHDRVTYIDEVVEDLG